ncbi:MAG: hypothetical protein JWQ14_3438 [Adhaeribacter sp.]|nr:hypothetical protein [Adhaeribacter sp.]
MHQKIKGRKIMLVLYIQNPTNFLTSGYYFRKTPH